MREGVQAEGGVGLEEGVGAEGEGEAEVVGIEQRTSGPRSHCSGACISADEIEDTQKTIQIQVLGGE